MRSFADAQINLEFSGIPDDVEVTIDAWVTTLANLEDEGTVDQELNQNVDPNAADSGFDAKNDQLSINGRRDPGGPLSLPKITRHTC